MVISQIFGPSMSHISFFWWQSFHFYLVKNAQFPTNCKMRQNNVNFGPKCSPAIQNVPGTPAVPALFSCLGQGVIFYQIKKAVQFLDLADLTNVFKVWYAGNTSFICKNKLWPTGPPGGPEIWPIQKLPPDSYYTQKIVIVLNPQTILGKQGKLQNIFGVF